MLIQSLKILIEIAKEFKINTKRIGLIFLFSSCIQAVSDILLIVSLIPILTLVSGGPDTIGFETIIYKSWLNILAIFQIKGIWLVAGFTAFLNSIVKIIAYYLGIKFALSSTTDIAEKIFEATIYKPFNKFVTESSSSIQAEITYIDLLESQIFKNFSKMINSLISLLIISFGIIIIDGKSFIIISTLLAFIYLFISYISKNSAYKFGTRKAKQREGMFRIVNEIFNNIKTIILLDLRKIKLNKLTQKERKYRKAALWINLLSVQPRFLIEGISLFIVCLWGGWLNYKEGYNIAILSVGTLIFGFRKLLPDMQQIYISYAQLNSNEYVLKLIKDKLNSTEREDIFMANSTSSQIKNFKKPKKIIIELKDISYFLLNDLDKKIMLKPIDLKIQSCQSLLISGKSGGGKSTLLNIISGLQKQSSGQIFADIDGQKFNSLYDNNWRRLISYTPQDIELVSGTIKDNIIYSEKELVNEELLKKVCDISGIPFYENDNGFNLHSVIGENCPLISGGQSQRVGIARALYNRRPIMIFDESTSALDESSERSIILKTRESYKKDIFILVSHNRALKDLFSLNIEL